MLNHTVSEDSHTQSVQKLSDNSFVGGALACGSLINESLLHCIIPFLGPQQSFLLIFAGILQGHGYSIGGGEGVGVGEVRKILMVSFCKFGFFLQETADGLQK